MVGSGGGVGAGEVHPVDLQGRARGHAGRVPVAPSTAEAGAAAKLVVYGSHRRSRQALAVVDREVRSPGHVDGAGRATGILLSGEDLLEAAQEASVIKLVNEIIIEAVSERASDIHIEPYEHHMSIRYRIDGVLQEASVPPQMNRFQAAIISRIKILANLNIAERRIPQDGRIKFQVGGRQIDVRVSVIPMLFGEGVVMRLLDKSNVLFTLQQLGMDDETYALFKGLIDRPHGIFLVTGPTGAGKTTTLYAALNAIVGPGIKVLTVEDPVEYHLGGVNQIPDRKSVV